MREWRDVEQKMIRQLHEESKAEIEKVVQEFKKVFFPKCIT